MDEVEILDKDYDLEIFLMGIPGIPEYERECLTMEYQDDDQSYYGEEL
jgi:hypothetical protein